MRKTLWTLALLSAGLAGCNDDRVASTVQINQYEADSVILPRVQASRDSAQQLAQAISSSCQQNNALDEARPAWRRAFLDWQAASAFSFGPLSEETRQRIELFPDPRNLVQQRSDALLAAEQAPTQQDIARATAPIQGFPALEYLLFGPVNQHPQACATARAISQHLADRLSQLQSDWQSYLSQVFINGETASLTVLVEAITRAIVVIRDDELGAVLGNETGNAARPQWASAPWSGASIAAMNAELDSLLAMINGSQGPALAHRMRSLGAGLYAEDLSALILQTQAALGRTVLPLSQAVTQESSRQALYGIFDGVFKQLRNRVQDLGGAVGVTPGFNANDGD